MAYLSGAPQFNQQQIMKARKQFKTLRALQKQKKAGNQADQLILWNIIYTPYTFSSRLVFFRRLLLYLIPPQFYSFVSLTAGQDN